MCSKILNSSNGDGAPTSFFILECLVYIQCRKSPIDTHVSAQPATFGNEGVKFC